MIQMGLGLIIIHFKKTVDDVARCWFPVARVLLQVFGDDIARCPVTPQHHLVLLAIMLKLKNVRHNHFKQNRSVLC